MSCSEDSTPPLLSLPPGLRLSPPVHFSRPPSRHGSICAFSGHYTFESDGVMMIITFAPTRPAAAWALALMNFHLLIGDAVSATPCSLFWKTQREIKMYACQSLLPFTDGPLFTNHLWPGDLRRPKPVDIKQKLFPADLWWPGACWDRSLLF